MPELKKAELIDGIVLMTSPVRLDQHGEPDNLIQGWRCNYSLATPGVKAATNATLRLGPDDVPQPDGLLRILPECVGQARLDPKGYLLGAPERVAEVSASTASLDVRDKLTAYPRAGVRESVVWRTEDGEVDWWVLDEDEHRPLAPGADGVLRSRVFAELWLDVGALLPGDGAGVMTVLPQGLESKEHAAFVAELEARARTGHAPPPP